MSRRITMLVVTLALLTGSVAVGREPAPRQARPIPGQIKILSVNARQNGVLGLKKFEDMFELSHAVRRRPPAWNGGSDGAIAAPDVITLQEVRSSNVEILVRLIRQRFSIKYRVAGFEDAASQIAYNPQTVTLVGEVVTWKDVCSNRSPGRREDRFYQFARFTDSRSGVPFTVAGMHIPKNFTDSELVDCYLGNVRELKDRLAAETSAVFIAGDFNKRPVETPYECDPNEFSPSLDWYALMTSPPNGERVYLDAVREHHRDRRLSLASQWTHEQRSQTLTCDNSSRIRRSRIDYIFYSDAEVAEASADSPGWGGARPGTTHPGNHKYSDHRFVWGRFIIGGVPRVSLPDINHGTRGRVDLTWTPVEEATAYRIYRATADHEYSFVGEVPGLINAFSDGDTRHDTTYRYVVAAVLADGSQGHESRPVRITVDRQGPQVVATSPSSGAQGVDQRAQIRITYNEAVGRDSVTPDRIKLFRGNKRISGTVRQVKARVLVFDPDFPLWKGKWHRVEAAPVQDRFGNTGGTRSFTFKVEEPRKKRR